VALALGTFLLGTGFAYPFSVIRPGAYEEMSKGSFG